MKKEIRLSSPFAFLMLGLAALFYLYEFLLRVAPAAMYTNLMSDFHVTATDLGLLSSLYFVTYGFLQAPVGVWADQFGPRRLLTFACMMCAIGAYVFAQSDTFFAAGASRLLIGAGSAFAFISCMKISSLWFKPAHFPLLAGLTLTLGNAGAVFGEGPVSLALESIPWRHFMIWIAWAGILLGLLLWFVVRDKPHHRGERRHFFPHLMSLGRHPQNCLIGLYGFLTTAPTDAFGGLWAVPFLVDVHGLSRSAAAAAASMTFVGVGLGSPVLGALSNMMKNRRSVMCLSSAITAITLFMLIFSTHLNTVEAFFYLFAFGFFGSYVMVFVVIEELNSRHLSGAAVGFANMMSIIGSMLLQFFIGWLLDLSWEGTIENGVPVYSVHDYRLSLLTLPIFYLISAFVIVPLLKETFREKSLHGV